MNLYYTGTQENVQKALNQINKNCNFPTAGVKTWDTPMEAYQQNFWFIKMPPPQGYKNEIVSYTQEQMILGVVEVTEHEFSKSWLPPTPP